MVYKKFTDWCKPKNIGVPTESECLAYFVESANSVKPTTLWKEYSMIKALLSAKQGVDLKDFTSLTEFIKTRALGYQCKRTKVFTKEQIIQFVKEAPDKKYLMMKVGTFLDPHYRS